MSTRSIFEVLPNGQFEIAPVYGGGGGPGPSTGGVKTINSTSPDSTTGDLTLGVSPSLAGLVWQKRTAAGSILDLSGSLPGASAPSYAPDFWTTPASVVKTLNQGTAVALTPYIDVTAGSSWNVSFSGGLVLSDVSGISIPPSEVYVVLDISGGGGLEMTIARGDVASVSEPGPKPSSYAGSASATFKVPPTGEKARLKLFAEKAGGGGPLDNGNRGACVLENVAWTRLA